MNERNPFIFLLSLFLGALVMSGGLVLGLWLHGKHVATIRDTNVITVTGSAKRRVNTDLAKWTVGFSQQATLLDIKDRLNRVDANAGIIRKFITGNGIGDPSITFLPIQTDPIYESLPNYGQSQKMTGYTLRQEIRVESSEIDKIDQLAKQVNKLADQGIVADYQRTEYFYTKIAELRPELFAEATKDAQERAKAIVSGTGTEVGFLRSAGTGVIQILSPNSIDVADYGVYDLSTREKDIIATVSVNFAIKEPEK